MMNGNFASFISGAPGQKALAAQILRCAGVFLSYVIPCLMILIPLRFFTRVPSFVFRKLLHFVAFSCVCVMILASESWQAAALTAVLIAILIYPLLAFFENRPWFSGLFVQKSPGEIKRSMLYLFLMFALVIFVSWGVFSRPHIAAAAILMWGTGDAAAALVGIPFGRHKVRCRLADGKKSWEGSGAMLLVSFISGIAVLRLAEGMSLPKALLAAGAGALAGTLTELFSPSEYDTVTVPAAVAAVLLAAEFLL
jgi:dolichol kinase